MENNIWAKDLRDQNNNPCLLYKVRNVSDNVRIGHCSKQ